MGRVTKDKLMKEQGMEVSWDKYDEGEDGEEEEKEEED